MKSIWTKKYRGSNVNGTIPDATFPTLGSHFNYYKKGVIVEVKSALGGIVNYSPSTNRNQIRNYLNYLSSLSGATKDLVAAIVFVVPSGTALDPQIITEANNRNIRIYLAEAKYRHSTVKYGLGGHPIITRGGMFIDEPILQNGRALGLPNGNHANLLGFKWREFDVNTVEIYRERARLL